ncbi:GntR family transcriptional regulator [Actinacidiphila bryophytorum]|uniref:Transcriptional regulator, GntR family n=1 Tax=Actinacidiphila bryophytorum TaxID=1436133 RepID=A0A9W4E1M7_9ACTN|nr:GntR family transcriptional regulator [Actinacidiphila bryophytorum]MBM9440061.1 GntR family transcriptional regulator [Actinacidiphila bryophytorum]MBN6543927.1 GntR family transcriptional regulator [Actinacidiphila bryophytorum]CAG7603228.1 Transcriptional regulator, GntR family [Actinacidiphila bryophytorum]
MAFGEQPAYLRVADDLRRKILDGTLPPHARLPSQARIRTEYGVSDTVALEARKVLMAEGFVEGRSGSGTYVRERPRPRRVVRSGYRPAGPSTPYRQEQADEGSKGSWESRSVQDTATLDVAERLRIEPGERVMRTHYLFRTEGEPALLSTSWEPLALTGRTPVLLPEEGPVGGQGVVARMAAIDVTVDHMAEEVGARPGLAAETAALGGVPGHLVIEIRRTYYASGLPVETADVIIPAEKYRAVYHLPVR